MVVVELVVVGGVVVVVEVVVGGVVVVVEVGEVGNVFMTEELPTRAAIMELSPPSIPIAHAPTPLIP
jgi:hypothetical protein